MDAIPNQQQEDRWRILKWVVIFIFLGMFTQVSSDPKEYRNWQSIALFGLGCVMVVNMLLLPLGLIQPKLQMTIMIIAVFYTFGLTSAIVVNEKNWLMHIAISTAGLVVIDMLLLLHVPNHRYVRILHIVTMFLLVILIFLVVLSRIFM